MTEHQWQALDDWDAGILDTQEFWEAFGPEGKDVDFIKSELKLTLEGEDPDKIELLLGLIYVQEDRRPFLHELNALLLEPRHQSHQWICKTLQDLGDPSSVPFIRQVLQQGFEYLAYTCSESQVIAKWFSWALYCIGTEEAIAVLHEFAESEDEGIREEMRYRLGKIGAG